MNPLNLLRRPEDEESTMAAPDLSDITIDEESPNSEYWSNPETTEPAAPYINELDQADAAPDLESLPDTSALADSPVHNELMEHLKNVPEHEKVGFWRKLAAGLTGAAVGLGSGAGAGMAVAKGIVDDPFRKAVDRWKLRGSALQTAAADERGRNSLLGRMTEGANRRNMTRETNSINLLKGVSAERGRDSRFKAGQEGSESRLERSQAGADRRHAEDLAARDEDRRQREGASMRTDQRLRDRAGKGSTNGKETNEQRKARREQAIVELAKDERFSKFYGSGDTVGGSFWKGYSDSKPKLNVDSKGKPAVNFDSMSTEDFQAYENALMEKIKELKSKGVQ